MRCAALSLAVVLGLGCYQVVGPVDRDAGDDAGDDAPGDAPCVGSPCDPRNCGACGVSCGEGEVCAAGVCRAPAPTVRWVRSFRGTGGSAAALAFDRSGELYVAGNAFGDVDLGTGALRGSARGAPVLARYDRFGGARWARDFAAAGSDASGFTSASLGPDATLWTAGTFAYQVNVGGETLRAGSLLGGLFAAYDASGAHRFSLSITSPPAPRGSSPDNRFVAAAATPDGDGIVAGYYEANAVLGGRTYNNGRFGGIVARYGPRGEARWVRTLLGSAALTLRDVKVDASGDIVVAGVFAGSAELGTRMESHGTYDAFVARLDARGEPRWAVALGGPGEDVAERLALGPDGTAYVTGATQGGFRAGALLTAGRGFLVAVDADGTPRWVRSYVNYAASNPDASTHGVAVNRAGHVLVTGSWRGSLIVEGRTLRSAVRSGFVAAYSAAGDPLWSRDFAGFDLLPYAVATDACGSIAVGGTFGGTVPLGAATLATGAHEAFVAMWDE
ncbi:MAG: hypothetical protein U0324_43730 [Polyangiales bacterium]